MLNTRPGSFDPRRTAITFFGIYAEVNGHPRYPKSHENGVPQIELHGLKFESATEAMIAELLVQQGVRFLHHVRFPFSTCIDEADVWSPDFLFDRPYLWPDVGSRLTHHWLIHGLEIKGTSFHDGIRLKKRQLVEDHNVHIHLLSRFEVANYVRKGVLPLVPYVEPVSERFDPPITITNEGIVGRIVTR